MDATELGIQIFFLILLPGFTSGLGFRIAGGFRSKGSDFASICYAALCGFALFSLWRSGVSESQLSQFIAVPLSTGFALAIGGFLLGFVLGLPIGWVRSKIRI